MRTKSTWLTQVFIGAIIVPTALHQIHLGSSSSNERTANSVIRGVSVEQHWLPITFKWENKHLLNQNIRLDAFTIIYKKKYYFYICESKVKIYFKAKVTAFYVQCVCFFISVRDLNKKISCFGPKVSHHRMFAFCSVLWKVWKRKEKFAKNCDKFLCKLLMNFPSWKHSHMLIGCYFLLFHSWQW